MRRRAILHAAAALAACLLVPRLARTQQADLEPYQRARIDWRRKAVPTAPAGVSRAACRWGLAA